MESSKLVKMVILDDSRFDRQLLKDRFSEEGFDVATFATSVDLVKSLDKGLPDILLLDIRLNSENGNTVLTQLRHRFSSIVLPIIMVTGNSGSEQIVQSLNLGANDYITKPVDIAVAVSRIQVQLQITNLSKKVSQLEKIQAINAMVTTYHHELNNPLTICLGLVSSIQKNIDDVTYKKITDSLWRIADTIKKIQAVSEKQDLELTSYVDDHKMVKIK